MTINRLGNFMDIITKMLIDAPAERIFEAFVDKDEIGGFWFSSSSESWSEGQEIKLIYAEYNAEVTINITKLVLNKNITFTWGDKTVTITCTEQDGATLVTTTEYGFDPDEIEVMLGQKEGWIYMLSCLKAYIEHGVKIRAALQ